MGGVSFIDLIYVFLCVSSLCLVKIWAKGRSICLSILLDKSNGYSIYDLFKNYFLEETTSYVKI